MNLIFQWLRLSSYSFRALELLVLCVFAPKSETKELKCVECWTAAAAQNDPLVRVPSRLKASIKKQGKLFRNLCLDFTASTANLVVRLRKRNDGLCLQNTLSPHLASCEIKSSQQMLTTKMEKSDKDNMWQLQTWLTFTIVYCPIFLSLSSN